MSELISINNKDCHSERSEGCNFSSLMREELEVGADLKLTNSFTHPQSFPITIGKDVKKRIGFTLAEVLITIGIIGIVAALTIPSLITKYQKIVTANHLKKFYAMLNNTIRMAEDDYGGALPVTTEITKNNCVSTNDCSGILKTYFVPYMKDVVKISNTGWKNWKVQNAAGYGVTALNSFSKEAYCMSTGECFVLTGNGASYTYLLVDLNGKAGPNRVGRDIFFFALHFSETQTLINGYTYSTNANTTNTKLLDGCNLIGTGWSNGATCTEIIMRNNWKIPDKDYPW